MVLGLQEGSVKPEVAGGLTDKDGHTPRDPPPVYANDQETNWQGTEDSEERTDPIRLLRLILQKVASGWQMQGTRKGHRSLMLVCTELPLTMCPEHSGLWVHPASPSLWSPGTHGLVRGVPTCGERVGTMREVDSVITGPGRGARLYTRHLM